MPIYASLIRSVFQLLQCLATSWAPPTFTFVPPLARENIAHDYASGEKNAFIMTPRVKSSLAQERERAHLLPPAFVKRLKSPIRSADG